MPFQLYINRSTVERMNLPSQTISFKIKYTSWFTSRLNSFQRLFMTSTFQGIIINKGGAEGGKTRSCLTIWWFEGPATWRMKIEAVTNWSECENNGAYGAMISFDKMFLYRQDRSVAFAAYVWTHSKMADKDDDTRFFPNPSEFNSGETLDKELI